MSKDGEKSLLAKMKASGKSMVVFFGSQTGTGEEFAQRLVKNARLYGIKATIADPEEIDTDELEKLHEISNAVAVFILATYGEGKRYSIASYLNELLLSIHIIYAFYLGDPTDNAQELYDWMQQSHNLNGLHYAVSRL